MKRPKRKARAKSTPKRRTYSITMPAQLAALASMRRHDIVDQVVASGPMSIKEIAAAIGVAPSAVYYHVDLLCEVGLLLEAGQRRSGRKLEQLYRAPAPQMHGIDAFQIPRNRRVIEKIVRALCKRAAKDFQVGYGLPGKQTAGPHRNMRFFRAVARPDDATLELINAHMDAVAQLMAAAAGGDGQRVVLTWIGAPQASLKGRRRRS